VSVPRNIVRIDFALGGSGCTEAQSQTVEKTPRKPPASINQWFVPQVQYKYWHLRHSIEKIAGDMRLPRLVIQAVVRENSVPVQPGPAPAPRRRAA
jgi:hypothetical protein